MQHLPEAHDQGMPGGARHVAVVWSRFAVHVVQQFHTGGHLPLLPMQRCVLRGLLQAARCSGGRGGCLSEGQEAKPEVRAMVMMPRLPPLHAGRCEGLANQVILSRDGMALEMDALH